MIAIGADHAGFEYKGKIGTMLRQMRLEVTDFGTTSAASTDYPDYAHTVSLAVASGKADFGILVCGTGIGMAITANKHQGIRAANVESVKAATLARQHNNANILCIGARLTDWPTAEAIVQAFLATPFEGGRHERRVEKIHLLTQL
jgi:ribose 5-phosphate isomerase B